MAWVCVHKPDNNPPWVPCVLCFVIHSGVGFVGDCCFLLKNEYLFIFLKTTAITHKPKHRMYVKTQYESHSWQVIVGFVYANPDWT